MEKTKYDNIPKEKFQFASVRDLGHDKKLATKPRSYMRDALSRFCKNKGAIVGAFVILFLLLFAIVVPFFHAIYGGLYRFAFRAHPAQEQIV